MIKKLFIALYLLPSICFPAAAQMPNDWIPVARGVQGEIFFVDKNNIQSNGSVYGFWVHVDHKFGNTSATRIYMAANCGTDAIQYGWIIEASRTGQITKNERVNMAAMQAVGGTINGQLVNAVCAGFSTDPQLAALTRRVQTNTEAINRAMESVANLYR